MKEKFPFSCLNTGCLVRGGSVNTGFEPLDDRIRLWLDLTFLTELYRNVVQRGRTAFLSVGRLGCRRGVLPAFYFTATGCNPS